ncbi:MAG: metallophosphoesterase [Gemella sp.]|nr:metallophosphoesterase [Gemella sp.]
MNYSILFFFFIILLLISIYVYKKISIILLIIFPNVKLRLISFILAAIPLIMVFSRSFSSFLIFIFYVIIFSILIDSINIYVKRFNNKTWKIIHRFLIIPIIVSTIFTSYGYYNAHNIQKTTYNIISEKDIKQDYKIALISDLHFGNNFNLEKLKEQVNIISADNPDLVVLAGDIVDEQTPVDTYEEVFKILSSIKSTYGVYYILGNHDENRYINPTDDRNTKLNNAIKNTNIIVLNDTSKQINGDIFISGRIDYSYERDAQRIPAIDLIKELDTNKFLLVADHQPSQYKENKEAGFDLQVSGHTHAGQIWPFGIVTSSIGFDYGLLKEDNFNLVVSSGMGLWGMPVRTEEKSEYVIIEIKKK